MDSEIGSGQSDEVMERIEATDRLVEPVEVIAARCLGSCSYHQIRSLECFMKDGVLVVQGRVSTQHLKQVAHHALKHLDVAIRFEVTVGRAS